MLHNRHEKLYHPSKFSIKRRNSQSRFWKMRRKGDAINWVICAKFTCLNSSNFEQSIHLCTTCVGSPQYPFPGPFHEKERYRATVLDNSWRHCECRPVNPCSCTIQFCLAHTSLAPLQAGSLCCLCTLGYCNKGPPIIPGKNLNVAVIKQLQYLLNN